MKRKFKFTELRVRGVKHQPGRPKPGKKTVKAYTIYWDSAQPGLGVRVTAAGARSYVFESRVNHRTLRVTIGAVGKGGWKLGEAQAEARRLTVECVDRDLDPRIVAKQEAAKADALRIEAQRHAHVLSAVWLTYIEACKAGWGERHLDDHFEVAHMGGERRKKCDKGSDKPGKTIPGPLAALMPLKLSELTADVVAAWLKREVAAKRPTSAAKAFRLLRAFVRWADERPEYKGAIASDACTARSVREALPSSKAKKNDCLQKGQLNAWFTAVRSLPNRTIAAYLQVLLLTGGRREELARLKWADVDSVWNSLVIRDKVEGTRMIPLTPYVASLLRALPHRKGNPWVFSSATAEGGRLMEPTKAHNAALTAAGLPHITLHGLRRSFRTLSGWLAMPVGVVAQIMGHKPSAIVEKHYEDRPLDMLAEHHTRLEAWILEQGGVPFVPLPAGRLGVVDADGSVRATA